METREVLEVRVGYAVNRDYIVVQVLRSYSKIAGQCLGESADLQISKCMR